MSYLTPFFNFPLFSARGHNYCLFLPIYVSFSSSQPFSGIVQPYDSKSLLFPFGRAVLLDYNTARPNVVSWHASDTGEKCSHLVLLCE